MKKSILPKTINKMKILSITAQKPSSTGSGIYLTEIVKELDKLGHLQAVVGGVYADDEISFPKGVEFYPVYFKSEQIPYPICGMSDEMPYENTRYCDMTKEMVEQFKKGFLDVITPLVEKFNPDIILSHHLYLLTAIVREAFPERIIYGFCHNTDLRQMKKNPLEQEYVREQIKKLDHIFVPQSAQEEGVKEIFGIESNLITKSGMGYNSEIFYDRNNRKNDGINRVIFAGKIAEKKGLFSLIRSFDKLKIEPSKLEIIFAGGAGNQKEYDDIVALANKSRYKISFPGRMSQEDLANLYSQSDIFVLPSFCEGIPLTVIEALACGCRAIMTNLPGIPEWISEVTDNADISYVELPELVNTDEAVPESLPAFEDRLTSAIEACIKKKSTTPCDLSRVSWKGITKMVLSI